MTHDEAVMKLRTGGSLVELMEAIGTVNNDPKSRIAEIMLGLIYGGCVAEQASLALYRRTGRPYPAVESEIATDPEDWMEWFASPERQRA